MDVRSCKRYMVIYITCRVEMKVLAVTIVMGQRFFAKRYKRCHEGFLRFMRDVFTIVVVHNIHNMVRKPILNISRHNRFTIYLRKSIKNIFSQNIVYFFISIFKRLFRYLVGMRMPLCIFWCTQSRLNPHVDVENRKSSDVC